jgi:inorganic phosphate transporter, PiT family
MLTFFVLLAGFYLAWNMGANDVANAMGTSVGSKALTLKRAVLLAAGLEFCGAFFVGSTVSHTIQEGLVTPHLFIGHSFCCGMLGALLATGVLLHLASYFGLPLSTTHALVGAVLGFGWIVGGAEAIQWSKVGEIAASWILSPLFSGALSYAIFSTIQQRTLEATQRLVPVFLFACFFLVCWSLFYEGIFQVPFTLSSTLTLCGGISFMGAFLGSRPRYHGDVNQIFIFLQIVSASLVAFAHGTNDVSNAIGPMNAILSAAGSGSRIVPSWLLAFGGAGIVLGLATWGWRVIETVGNKITDLTPSRGFAAEFSAATTILVASKLGLPISTTHALVGAICGVGMARGVQTLNLRMLKEIVISWIVTMPLSALMSICFYALLYTCFQ